MAIVYQYPFKKAFEFGTPYGRKGSLWRAGYHTGLDMKSANYGGDGLVYPIADGVVRQISTTGSYGNHIYVLHPDGYLSLYAHLHTIAVREGQPVATNTVLGREGMTGNATGVHLHLEIHKGEYIYPASIDPKEFLDAKIKEGEKVEYFIEKIKPSDFDIVKLGAAKRSAAATDYFNLDYFGGSPMMTVCNLATNGKVIAETAAMSGTNTAGKKQTTLIVLDDGTVYMDKVDKLSDIDNLRCAIGGVPFMVNGMEVSLSRQIKTEGWSGGNFYKTWHGFLTVQNNEIWYIAANVGHSNDVKATTVIWEFLRDIGATGTVIKLDGGGSFIYKKDGKMIAETEENRKIHYIGTFAKKEQVSSWAATAWDKAIAAGVVDGSNPQGNVTREQMVVILDRLELIKGKE